MTAVLQQRVVVALRTGVYRHAGLTRADNAPFAIPVRALQMNIFAIRFPVTLGVGLVGVLLTRPMMQAPFTVALERMLSRFHSIDDDAAGRRACAVRRCGSNMTGAAR